jgi:hypothetical protein
MILLGCLALWKPFTNRFWQLRIPSTGSEANALYPVGAVDYLRDNNFKGNLMVPFFQGSYVSWELSPEVKVSVDSRYEVAYDPEWMERTFQLYEVRGDWQSVLNQYPTDAVLVITDSSLMKALQDQLTGRWHKRYQDPYFSVFLPASKAADYPQTQTETVPPGSFP